MSDCRNLAVIGAGWYGLHLTMALARSGHNVRLFEANRDIMLGAGSQNQLRIHQGFHYLRDSKTRRQALLNFHEFVHTYGFLTREIVKNTYAVPSVYSLLDANTCELIMHAEAMRFEALDDISWDVGSKIERAWTCGERLFLPNKAREFFKKEIGEIITLESPITWMGTIDKTYSKLHEDFEIVIDATYSGVTPFGGVIYEATLIAEFDADNLPFGALTLIDGPLFSIFPTETLGTFSLSHVTYSKLKQFSDLADADKYLASISLNSDKVTAAILQMRHHVAEFLPQLKPHMESLRPRFIQKKVKPLGASDSRDAHVDFFGNTALVRAGKLDAVFEVEKLIRSGYQLD